MNRSLGTRSLLASILLMGVAAGTGCMPLLPEPEAPDPSLNKNQVQAVVNCQDEINDAGRKFVRVKFEKLELCAQDILALQLADANDLISEEEYDKKLEKIRDKCDEHFRKITKASTKFVDSVINACTPAEEWILGSDSGEDALSFQAYYGGVDSVEDLAGALCVFKELSVDQTIFFQMPRLIELLSHLGEGYIVPVDGEGSETSYIPNIPLDERCPIDEFDEITELPSLLN